MISERFYDANIGMYEYMYSFNYTNNLNFISRSFLPRQYPNAQNGVIEYSSDTEPSFDSGSE